VVGAIRLLLASGNALVRLGDGRCDAIASIGRWSRRAKCDRQLSVLL